MHPRPGECIFAGQRDYVLSLSRSRVGERANVLSLSRELRFVRRVRSWIYTAATFPAPKDFSYRHCISHGHKGDKRGVDDPDGARPRTIRFEYVRRSRVVSEKREPSDGGARILTSIHKPIWNATDHTYYMTHAGCRRRLAHKNLLAVRGYGDNFT